MKKILILSIAFLAIALMPQNVTAQTDVKVEKAPVTSKAPGDVVPVRKAKAGKTAKVQTKPMAKEQKATRKAAAKAEKKEMKEKKEVKADKKEPIKLIVRPVDGGKTKAKKIKMKNKKKAEMQ